MAGTKFCISKKASQGGLHWQLLFEHSQSKNTTTVVFNRGVVCSDQLPYRSVLDSRHYSPTHFHIKMLSVRTTKVSNVNGSGYKKNPFWDSPGSDDTPADDNVSPLDQMTTPGSNGSPKIVAFESSNFFEPHSPPMIQRTTGDNLASVEKGSPCDSSSWATSRQSHEVSPTCPPRSPTVSKNKAKKSKIQQPKEKFDTGVWGVSSSLRQKIKHMKRVLPKVLKAMHASSTKKSLELTDLSVATLCLMPRNGAGMEDGRQSFERLRTSLMLHMMQQSGNGTWLLQDASKYEGEKGKSVKGRFAKLNNRLHDCIEDENSSFTEKSQEAVQIAKGLLEVSNIALNTPISVHCNVSSHFTFHPSEHQRRN